MVNQYPNAAANGGDPRAQIAWGMSYIAGRYGNPAKAWQHENQFNWYSRGTRNVAPGVSIVGEDGPEAIVSGGGQSIMTAGQTAGMLAQIQSGQGRPIGRRAGVALNLNFQPGSIVIGGGMGGGSDVSSSAREFAEQIGQYMEQNTFIKKLAMGVS
jgi:hypothetical protein